MNKYAIALHGGAGNINLAAFTVDKRKVYDDAMQQALEKGITILEKGGSSLDAVEAVVKELEDCPLFNAGRGAVYNAAGKHEMDAAIMCGKTKDAGAVAGISNIKNPVALARLVMEQSKHVLLIGKGAMDFAQEKGIPIADDSYFYDEYRYNQWKKLQQNKGVQLDHTELGDKKFGTVGAVAKDLHGNIAAATSTGGMTNKMLGRVGDSPIIGAGTYADNNTCAISCTGHGEFFIKNVVAYDVACLVEYKDYTLQQACNFVIHEKLKSIGAEGA